ncbi:unnamed protein product, partial [Closterium sp. Yama58-4]
WRMGGGYAIHALVLQALIEFALTPLLTPQMHTSSQLHEHRVLGDDPMANGLVEFEGAWRRATEDEPLCFERVLLPGILKGQVFPSSPAQAGYLRRHLRVKLRLQPPPAVLWGPQGVQGWRARVLYITRLGAELRQRRTLLPESHEALLRLMEEMNMEHDLGVEVSSMHDLADIHTSSRPCTSFPPLHGPPPNVHQLGQLPLNVHQLGQLPLNVHQLGQLPLNVHQLGQLPLNVHQLGQLPLNVHQLGQLPLNVHQLGQLPLNVHQLGQLPLNVHQLGQLPLNVHQLGQLPRHQFLQLTFKQQFEAIQSADIILSLHGAALANPPLFARRTTAVIEIMPYHVLHETYYAMALSAGLPYFMKMCRHGSFQGGDRAEVDALSLYECTHGHPECKEYFTHRRRVELTEEDLSDLRVILGTAREVVAAGLGGMGGVVGPDELPGWAERRFGERCVARDAGLFCRNDFVRIVGGTGDFTCVFSRDCEGQEQPQ